MNKAKLNKSEAGNILIDAIQGRRPVDEDVQKAHKWLNKQKDLTDREHTILANFTLAVFSAHLEMEG